MPPAGPAVGRPLVGSPLETRPKTRRRKTPQTERKRTHIPVLEKRCIPAGDGGPSTPSSPTGVGHHRARRRPQQRTCCAPTASCRPAASSGAAWRRFRCRRLSPHSLPLEALALAMPSRMSLCKFVRLLKHILPALPLTAARAARDTARRAARARDGELGDMDHVPHRGCLPDTTQRTRRRAGRAPWHTARVALSCVRPGRRALEHVHRCLLGDGGHRGLHRPPPIPVRSRCAGWHRARGLAHQLERRPLLLLLQARWPTPARALFFVLTLLFRDATLFRETVECLLVQHHMAGYPHTVADPLLRAHAIACLWWSINGPWVVVPLLSFAWVARRLLPLTGGMVAALRREVKRGEAMAAAAAAATTARDAPARGSGGPESRHAHISGHGRSPSSCSEAM